MPKNTVTDPITDQEIAFAHLILSGTMNDRRAAEAVGLNPETAAYTKAKPRVRAYMIENRAAVREGRGAQERARVRRQGKAGGQEGRRPAPAEHRSRPNPGPALGTGHSQPRSDEGHNR